MTAPDRAALGERAARALQSALGEPLAKVLERVTDLLVAVDYEAAQCERHACLKPIEIMRKDTQARANRAEQMRDWETCGSEAAAVEVLDSMIAVIRARGNESKAGVD